MTAAGQELMDISDFNDVKRCPWSDLWRDRLNDEAGDRIRSPRR